jgi:lipopolysaccharide export system protein LptA
LSGAKAVYTAETGDLELSGNPVWKSGQHQGKGNLITVNPNREEMFVRGDAWMRVPAKELGSPESAPSETVPAKPPARPIPAQPSKGSVAKAKGPIFSPVPGLEPASPPPSPAAVSPKSSSFAFEEGSAQNPKPEEFADLYSEEYSFKPNQARFRQHVRIIHPQMNWRCDNLGVDSTATEKNFTMLAEGSVDFALSASNKPPVHGVCERAEYIHDLTVNPIIDRMEMTGHPVLEATNAVVRNSIIILDQARHVWITPGEYAISGKSSVLGTNVLHLMPQKR